MGRKWFWGICSPRADSSDSDNDIVLHGRPKQDEDERSAGHDGGKKKKVPNSKKKKGGLAKSTKTNEEDRGGELDGDNNVLSQPATNTVGNEREPQKDAGSDLTVAAAQDGGNEKQREKTQNLLAPEEKETSIESSRHSTLSKQNDDIDNDNDSTEKSNRDDSRSSINVWLDQIGSGSDMSEGIDQPFTSQTKRFSEAKSLSNLNYLHSDQVPGVKRRKSLTDLNDDDKSLGDEEVFELDLQIPRPKKQFLEAALAAKSASDLNFIFSSPTPDGSLSLDPSDNDSMDDMEVFASMPLAPPPKKQFLEASLMAKSLSDLNYLHSDQRPRIRRRKSLTDLNDDDDKSLGDEEVFELDLQIPRPKKQFLEAALMAKSMSDLKFMQFNSTTVSSLQDNESRDDTSNIVPEHLLGLSQPNLSFHSSDAISIDNDDLFESQPEDPPIGRSILKAALEAKAQQQGEIIVVSRRDEPNCSSDDDGIDIVPEHLVIANQPATTHSKDNYSIEVEDIFEASFSEQMPEKPLLKAALEARAQQENEYAKSFSHLGTDEHLLDPSSAYRKFSQSVPDHLAIVHQPTNALLPLDELSIDDDRLFDAPDPVGKNPLLVAALRAKGETKRTEPNITKSGTETST